MNTKNILTAAGQDPVVAAYAQTYVLTYLPCLYFQCLDDIQRKFLYNYKKNKFSFICTCFGVFVPISIVLMNTKNILTAAGQDPVVAAYAQTYVLTYLPGLYFQCLDDIQRKFLYNYKKNKFAFICTCFGALLHGLWCYVFVIKFNLGIEGIGIANLIS